jgi:hypothetical protein
MADRELRAEYQAEIAPRTRAAVVRVLDGARERLAGVRRVLDLGAGTGAAGQAVAECLPGVEVVPVDKVAATRGVIVADLRREVRPPGLVGDFDLIVAAHLLNELAATATVAQRAALVFAWARELLAEGGHILLIEPALRETGRDLLGVRDRLVEAGFFVVAPCFWQGPCPALVRDRDWCHDAAPWPGESVGLSRADFAYLLLSRGREDGVRDKRVFRVVSDRLVEKGRLRVFGCGPAGRHPLVRLNRDESGANADFDRVERGDVIVAETERAGDGLRIGAASRVEKR